MVDCVTDDEMVDCVTDDEMIDCETDIDEMVGCDIIKWLTR